MTSTIAESFLHITVASGTPVVRGDRHGMLGHKIERGRTERADGVFAEWDWNGERLLVRNDRYGFFPLFYFADRNSIGVSTSIPQLLAKGAPRSLNYNALSVFLRLGFFLREDTPFDGIFALPPCATLIWSRDSFHVTSDNVLPDACCISRPAAISAYIDLFRQAIERRRVLTNGQRVVVPLSGGRDSRHILLELCRQGTPPASCVSVGRMSAGRMGPGDADVAMRVAAAVGVDHRVIDLDSFLHMRFDLELAKNVQTSFCSDEHTWMMPLADNLEHTADVIYDGIGGDVLSDNLFEPSEDRLAALEAGRFRETAARLLDEGTGCIDAFDQCLTDRARRSLSRDVAIHHLAEELQRHVDRPNPVASFFFWNRTRREIALSPYGVLRCVPMVLSPYLDHDLCSFLSSLPARFLQGWLLHTETIRTAYPTFSTIPYAGKNGLGHLPLDNGSRFSLRLLCLLLNGRRRELSIARRSYTVPRVVRCVFDRRYARGTGALLDLQLYLQQLEWICRDSG